MLYLVLPALTLAALLLLTVRDPLLKDQPGLQAGAVAAWLLSTALFAWRIEVLYSFAASTFILVALIILVIVASWGRPALLMADLFEGELTPQLERRSRIGQYAFIGSIIVLAFVTTTRS